jgi:hypothetical protein
MMGTHCRSIFIFFEHDEPKIFVNGFQPTIISNLHGRLFFSAVNLKVSFFFFFFFIITAKYSLYFNIEYNCCKYI